MRTLVNALLVLVAGAFILALLAVVAVSPAPLLLNPAIGLLAVVGAAILGARRAWWTAMVLAFAATTINLGLFLGLALARGSGLAGFISPFFILGASYLLVAFGLVCGAGWGLGRGLSLLVRSLRHHNGPISGGAKP